jgi:hypothetical protein
MPSLRLNLPQRGSSLSAHRPSLGDVRLQAPSPLRSMSVPHRRGFEQQSTPPLPARLPGFNVGLRPPAPITAIQSAPAPMQSLRLSVTRPETSFLGHAPTLGDFRLHAPPSPSAASTFQRTIPRPPQRSVFRPKSPPPVGAPHPAAPLTPTVNSTAIARPSASVSRRLEQIKAQRDCMKPDAFVSWAWGRLHPEEFKQFVWPILSERSKLDAHAARLFPLAGSGHMVLRKIDPVGRELPQNWLGPVDHYESPTERALNVDLPMMEQSIGPLPAVAGGLTIMRGGTYEDASKAIGLNYAASGALGSLGLAAGTTQGTLPAPPGGPSRVDFYASEEGIVFPTSQALLRKALETMRFPGSPTTRTAEIGRVHESVVSRPIRGVGPVGTKPHTYDGGIAL